MRDDGWDSKRLQQVAEIRVSNVDKKIGPGEKPVRLCNYLDVYTHDYINSGIDFMEASATRAEIERFGLRLGDVIITKDSETPDDIGIPAVLTEAVEELVCGYHLALVRPDQAEVDPVYLAKQLATSKSARHFAIHASGSTRFGLAISAIESVPIPVPPRREEQTKISEVLLCVDRAIDQTAALVAKQERITTGLVRDLLTRGIDQNGNVRSEKTHTFKNSALGRIPSEWSVKTVEECADITTGENDTQDRVDDGDYPFFVRSQVVERIGSCTFDGEAVLTAGDGVGVGKVFHYHVGKCAIHQRVYCIHNFREHMSGYFFFQYFRSHFMSRVAQFSAKGSVDSVRRAMISQMSLPCPGRVEQDKIVEMLKCAEDAEHKYQRELQKLRLQRTGLMQDLLTGRRRVTPLLEIEATVKV